MLRQASQLNSRKCPPLTLSLLPEERASAVASYRPRSQRVHLATPPSAAPSCSSPAALSSSNALNGFTAPRHRRSLVRVAAKGGDPMEPSPDPEAPRAISAASGLDTASSAKASDFRWGSHISKKPELSAAVSEAVKMVLAGIGEDAEPELAIVFITSTFGPQFDQVVPLLRSKVPSLKHIFGCSGYGVVGGGSLQEAREVEGHPGFSLTLGRLPGVDIKLRHTLRSSIPIGASPTQWASFVGVPHNTPKNTSFIILSDPRFNQLESILKGLDNTFPNSPKIGGTLSTSDRAKGRTMFAWTATGADKEKKRGMAMPGSKSINKYLKKRRQRPSGVVLSENAGCLDNARGIDVGLSGARNGTPASSPSSAPAPSRSSSSSSSSSIVGLEVDKPTPKKGFLSGLLGWLTKLVDEGQEASDNRDGGRASVRSDQEEEEAAAPSPAEVQVAGMPDGMHMYGAVVMALQGDVVLDTITSQGYRCPSGNLFRMVKVVGNSILSVMPVGEDASPLGSGAASSESSIVVRRIRDDDSEDDSDDDDEIGEEGEYMPFAAIVDMMEALGQTTISMGELGEITALAVATDNTIADEDLTVEDFELFTMEEPDSDSMITVDGKIRKGNRFKVMVRDKQGMQEDLRDKVLAYKRKDLQALMMGASNVPSTIGLLMFSDLSRGERLHGAPHHESKLLKTYLPVPISGFFGGAQVSVVNKSSSLLEETTVVGILRAAPSKQ